LWRMPRSPILDRSREWKGEVVPTNAIAESGALRGQVSRLGFEGFLAIRLREAATARISDARAAIRALQGLLHPAVARLDLALVTQLLVKMAHVQIGSKLPMIGCPVAPAMLGRMLARRAIAASDVAALHRR